MLSENPKEYFLNSELIVHAGGLSERWFPVTQGKIPKPLTEMGKKPRPMIDWVILPYVMAGMKKIFISLWHNPEGIMEHLDEISKNTGIEFVYLREPEDKRLGRAGVIKYYIERGVLSKDKPKISINGADIINMDIQKLVKFHLSGLEKGFFATVVVSPSEFSQFGRLKCDLGTKAVINFEEKPLIHLPRDEYVNTGAFYLDSELNKHFIEISEEDFPVDLEKSKILPQISRTMRCFEHSIIPLKTWFWFKNSQDFKKVKDMDFEHFFGIKNVEEYLGPYSPQNNQTL